MDQLCISALSTDNLREPPQSPYTIYATIPPTGISFHISSSQGSQLGKTVDEYFPQASYAASPTTGKVSQQGVSFLVRTNVISMSCDKYIVSSTTGLTKAWTLIENVFVQLRFFCCFAFSLIVA